MITFILEFNIDFSILPAIIRLTAELFVIAAIAILFSSFSTPFLSGFFTFGLFWIGRVSYELGQFGERSKNEFFKFFATGVQKIFDLESFDLRTEVVHGIPIYAQDFWLPLAYGFFLISICLAASVMFFRRRDFK